MDFFGSHSFEYRRQWFPLFFAPLSAAEQQVRDEVMRRAAREYYHLGTSRATTDQTLLSNGMTLGEFAMYQCARKHTKVPTGDAINSKIS